MLKICGFAAWSNIEIRAGLARLLDPLALY